MAIVNLAGRPQLSEIQMSRCLASYASAVIRLTEGKHAHRQQTHSKSDEQRACSPSDPVGPSLQVTKTSEDGSGAHLLTTQKAGSDCVVVVNKKLFNTASAPRHITIRADPYVISIIRRSTESSWGRYEKKMYCMPRCAICVIIQTSLVNTFLSTILIRGC